MNSATNTEVPMIALKNCDVAGVRHLQGASFKAPDQAHADLLERLGGAKPAPKTAPPAFSQRPYSADYTYTPEAVPDLPDETPTPGRVEGARRSFRKGR